MPVVQLVEERRFDPPRAVEVEHHGGWWPGFQHAWQVCDDGRGWMADVEWSERYDWGLGRHVLAVPPGRVRAVTGEGSGSPRRADR